MSIAYDLFKDSKDFREFAAGETIFESGETGDYMYVIIEGEVVIKAGGRVVDELKAGDILGEMALVDSSPRSASARARTACKVVALDEYDFTFYVQHSPFFALHVMSVMAQRLRRRMAE